MNLTKYILRGTLLLMMILLLVNLNRKTDDAVVRITKFKFETFNKIRADSLDTQHKLDVLSKETKKFSGEMYEDYPHLKEGVRYLMGIVGLLIVVEVGFFIAKRRRSGE